MCRDDAAKMAPLSWWHVLHAGGFNHKHAGTVGKRRLAQKQLQELRMGMSSQCASGRLAPNGWPTNLLMRWSSSSHTVTLAPTTLRESHIGKFCLVSSKERACIICCMMSKVPQESSCCITCCLQIAFTAAQKRVSQCYPIAPRESDPACKLWCMACSMALLMPAISQSWSRSKYS